MELESSQQSMVVHVKISHFRTVTIIIMDFSYMDWVEHKGYGSVIKSWHITMSIFKFYIILWVPLK